MVRIATAFAGKMGRYAIVAARTPPEHHIFRDSYPILESHFDKIVLRLATVRVELF